MRASTSSYQVRAWVCRGMGPRNKYCPFLWGLTYMGIKWCRILSTLHLLSAQEVFW
jgi:hypothetical protein